MNLLIFTVIARLVLASVTHQNYTPPYLTCPSTPSLPPAQESGYVNLSGGVDIWYAQFGTPLSTSRAKNKPPILFLHGALANAGYFGNQISSLLANPDNEATIIALDSRMQDRSTGVNGSISYKLMREDVVGVLDHFNISSVSIIGWSDGAITGLNLAMNAPKRVNRLFGFGTSYLVSNGNASFFKSPVVDSYLARAQQEYKELSPTPNDWPEAYDKVLNMLGTLPNYSQRQFSKIPTLFQDCAHAPLIWIVDGADEEVVNRDVPMSLHNLIPGSGLVILPSVSHYAFLQDPTMFDMVMEGFLNYEVNCS